MASLSALKRSREEEEVERAPPILSVSSLKAPTSSATIFPPGCSTTGGAGGLLGEAEVDVRIPEAEEGGEAKVSKGERREVLFL